MSRQIALAAGAAAAAGVALATWESARRAERARPPRGRVMTVAGVRLHYLDMGRGGPPAVLLHGNGSMVEDFTSSGLAERLAERRRVVIFDRPGFGRSDRPRDRVWTPEAQAAILLEAFGKLGLEQPVVLGHSWGSLVAMAMALDRPEALRGVVLAGGYFFATPRADVPFFVLPAVPVLGDALRYTVTPPLGRLMAGPLIRRIFAPLPVPPRFRREFPLPLALRPWQLRAVSEDTAFMIPAAARLAPRHAELRLPLAIVAGREDRIVNAERHSLRLHHAIPGSHFVMLPGAGHMVHHASPETVAEMVERVAA